MMLLTTILRSLWLSRGAPVQAKKPGRIPPIVAVGAGKIQRSLVQDTPAGDAEHEEPR